MGYDLAFSNLIVHFPRNKSLLPIWMKAVDILVARAKNDQKFGEIIVGISEGTFPSFQALTLDFILKILLQGGISGSNYFLDMKKQPSDFIEDGSLFWKSAKQILSEISHDRRSNMEWISQIGKKIVNVSKYAIKSTKD